MSADIVRWNRTSTGFTRSLSYISDDSDEASDISYNLCYSLQSSAQLLTSQSIHDSHNSDQCRMSPSFLFTKRLRGENAVLNHTYPQTSQTPTHRREYRKTLSYPNSSRLASFQRLNYSELPPVVNLYAGSLVSCPKDVTER